MSSGMKTRAVSFLPLLVLLSLSREAGAASQNDIDTAAINKRSSDAYINARRTPDISILMAHQSLSASRSSGYRKGIADASLALGMAYLAKYNQGDSAHYYNKLALETYAETGDIAGQARACYGLSYVFSFKGDLDSSEQYSNMALEYFEKAGDYRGVVNSLNVLAYLARQIQDLESAKGYIERAIKTAGDRKSVV